MTDAEDLAQEVFIQAWRRLDSFRGDSKFSSWLYRIGTNACLNWNVKVHRRQAAHQNWADLRDQSHSYYSSETETAQQVQDGLMKLPPKQRVAVVLTIYEGLTHSETARILGCSETTISWRVFTARARLKRILRHLNPLPGSSS